MSDNDINILNAALEHENIAIAAYECAINSNLLNKDVIQVAQTFQSHHGHHAGKIRELVQELGGKSPEPIPHEEYYKKLPTDKLTDQEAIVRYALKLEKGATIAYLNLVPKFEDKNIIQAAASILGTEAMHWTFLRGALGLSPVPVSFIPLTAESVEN